MGVVGIPGHTHPLYNNPYPSGIPPTPCIPTPLVYLLRIPTLPPGTPTLPPRRDLVPGIPTPSRDLEVGHAHTLVTAPTNSGIPLPWCTYPLVYHPSGIPPWCTHPVPWYTHPSLRRGLGLGIPTPGMDLVPSLPTTRRDLEPDISTPSPLWTE